MNIGENIKKYRKEKGFTQSQLSKLSDIPVITLGRYEREERVPGMDTLNKIAIALDVPLTAFTDEYDSTVYKRLITEAYSRDFCDDEHIIESVAKEMSDRELVRNLAYAKLVSELNAEENIIKYILSRIDDPELKNIEFTRKELSELFDFILISSNIKARELIKKK